MLLRVKRLNNLRDMVLTIKAIKYKGQPLASPLEAVFDHQGGKLGRSSNNHLVLADEEKFVSGEHAVIEYDNEYGGFYYIDTSLNGTQFTSRNQRIHNTKILLQDQDELRVGDYDLVLSIAPGELDTSHDRHCEKDRHAEDNDGMSRSMFDQERGECSISQTEDYSDDGMPHGGLNVMADTNNGAFQLDGSFVPPQVEEPSPPLSELPHDLSLDDFFDDEPPVETAESNSPVGRVPNVINETKPSAQHPPPNPGIVVAKAGAGNPGEASDILNVFFKAAGIEAAKELPQKSPQELMHIIGAVFRELVDGLMMVLRGRSELKSHLRVSVTTLKATENNPLKFSPTVEDALMTILTNHHPGFVDAGQAVREGYENIKNHQLAIHAGVQASLANILERFNPQHFSEKFEEGIVLQRKAKCWDEYKQTYRQIAKEALEDFFNEEFVCAYEQQIKKLSNNRT
jgi:type VI secretion system protein